MSKRNKKEKKAVEEDTWTVHCPKCRSSNHILEIAETGASSDELLQEFFCRRCDVAFYLDLTMLEEEIDELKTSGSKTSKVKEAAKLAENWWDSPEFDTPTGSDHPEPGKATLVFEEEFAHRKEAVVL